MRIDNLCLPLFGADIIRYDSEDVCGTRVFTIRGDYRLFWLIESNLRLNHTHKRTEIYKYCTRVPGGDISSMGFSIYFSNTNIHKYFY